MIPYRSEPLYIRPSPRLALGIPRGWEENYFLEFAPNVAKLVSQRENPYYNNAPKTKEEMMKKFLDEMGIVEDEEGGGYTINGHQKKKPVTKEDIAPSTWEVREQLRNMMIEHETVVEEIIEGSKYPILTKGEIDPRLKSKAERKRERKRFEALKERAYVEKAAKKKQIQRDEAGKPIENVHQNMKEMYEQTRNQFHRAIAPTRFFERQHSQPPSKRLRK